MTRLAAALALLVVLLAACEPYPAADLRKVESAARSTLDSAQSAVKATQDTVQQERTRATLQAAKTQGAAQIEIDLLQARIEATLQARDLELAAAQATDQARPAHATQTQAAIDAAGIKALQTQAVKPTQTAQALTIAHQLDLDRREMTLDLFWLYFWPAFGVVLLLTLFVLIIRLALNLYEHWLEWQAMRNSIRGPGGSRFAWDVNGRTFQAVPGTRPLPYHVPDPVHPLGAGEVAYASAMPSRKEIGSGSAHLTAKLLEDAIAVAGEESRMLPGWRVLSERGLDWTSESWQKATAPLVIAGAVVPQVRVGTYVSEQWYDLAGLLDAVETRKLRVSPTPPG